MAMTAQAQITAAGATPATVPVLDIRDTSWGFAVTEGAAGLSAALLSSAALRFGAVVLMLAAAAQWLLPGSLFSGDVLVMKLVLTLLLGVLAAVLMRAADRGVLAELQVDAALREVRLGTRSARGAAQLSNRIPMRDIEEVFVRPAAGRPGMTELCFRVTGFAEPVRIAAGNVADLAPVLERLTRDLRTPRERVTLRMAG